MHVTRRGGPSRAAVQAALRGLSEGLALYVFDCRPRGERWGFIRRGENLHLVLTAVEVAEVLRNHRRRPARFQGLWEIHKADNLKAAA